MKRAALSKQQAKALEDGAYHYFETVFCHDADGATVVSRYVDHKLVSRRRYRKGSQSPTK